MRAISFLLLISTLGAAQTDPPKRTMVSSPSGARPASTEAPAAAESQDAALAKYREMWRNMGPARQKAFVDAGGATPEQYERTLKQKPAQGAIDPTMDSLTRSLQDLNAIRDANLGHVQKDGCPPEVASRIADLKGKLQSYETGPAAAKSAPADPLAVAAAWNKPPAGPQPPPRDPREAKLLDEVLGGAKPRAAAKSPAAEQDIARIKAEIDQLSGACAAPGK